LTNDKVLAGVKVLDFGRFIAGPFCAALLADFGADVIRIDRLGGSEDRFIMPVTSDGEGALFLQVNRNKRSITLDLESNDGREILHRLLQGADVVVANMPPRTMARLGLDYASLCRIKPDIILTASSAFGTHEAVRDRVGFDGVGQSISGAVRMAGTPEHPAKAMVPVVDFATALSCALGTVMALYERRSSGRGQEVTSSLLHTALNLSSGLLIEEALLRLNRTASCNRSPNYGPSDIYRTRDGWIIVQVVGDGLFHRWVRLTGQQALLDDPRFQGDAARGEHGDVLSQIMQDWCASRTQADALEALEQARIPAGPVHSPRQTLDDPIVRESGAFQQMPYPGAPEGVPIVVPPLSMSRTPPTISQRPPQAGEHTDAILLEAGYTAADVARLRARKVI